MSIEDDLDKRKWPKPPFEIGPSTEKQDEREAILRFAVREYDRSAFVSEGRIVLRHLGWKGLMKTVPPGESAITSLALDQRGRILGLTSGDRSHLFVYDPEVDRAVDLCTIDRESIAKNSLVICREGVVFIGTRRRPGKSGPGRLLKFKTDFNETGWEDVGPKLEEVELPKADQGVECLVYDDSKERIYGLTSPGGFLFSLDVQTCSHKLFGPVDELSEFSGCLIVGYDGRVYGGKRWGKMFEFDPELEVITELPVRIPSLAGRQVYNRIDSMALDRGSGKIYGGGTADGVLFIFDPSLKAVTSLGKPTAQPRTRAIVVGKDRRVYGISGKVGGSAHLFRYDVQSAGLTDLGIPLAYSDQYWHGYEFDSMITGKYGEIYMGESDRISHLFIYYPPIER